MKFRLQAKNEKYLSRSRQPGFDTLSRRKEVPMGRISRLGPDQVGDDVKALFDLFLKERGNIPNMFRSVAHRPGSFTHMLAHFRAVMGPGTVTVALKEMVGVRVSR